MGKKNKSSSSKASSAGAECSCDHPFTCTCGNRPPRPSRGHKWDSATKSWGGKGHKQKGASGQTASVAKEAVTTNVGKTKLEQWQRLPSQLLDEVCKREGRPRPKFKCLSEKYLYRVILQDAKVSKRGTDHDIILVPNKSCPNEEQAKEEAALLGLLHLSPSLPHERKLPEPYKTTWLHAVSSSKPAAIEKKQASSNKPENKRMASQNDSSSSATASTSLRSAKAYVSVAERRLQQLEKNKARKERIRKHEAIRMANRDHQVFLSANCRKQIEALLRGDSNLQDLIDNAHDDALSPEEEGDDLKVYVMERLTHEGFTLAQARTAFDQVVTKDKTLASQDTDEEEWDRIHDDCLQWLCIHLSEEDLPEGFDPRGGTLDVILAPSAANEESIKPTKEVQSCSNLYGLTSAEATRMLQKAKTSSLEVEVYAIFLAAAATPSLAKHETAESSRQENLEVAKEEIEALEAIFPQEECKIARDDEESTEITIKLQDVTGDGCRMTLNIVLGNGKYPSSYPTSILLKEGWKGGLEGLGGSLHVSLLQFVATLTPGDPMVYEIYGKAQDLLHMATDGETNPVVLFPDGEKKPRPTDNGEMNSKTNAVENVPAPSKTRPKRGSRSTYRRPRPRSFFWSKTPRETPVATAFPKLSLSLDRARKSLPAARSRQEFLSALKRADKDGRVVLVTGATGSGKTTQIPQFILEENPQDAKIVVAQPRRLAATGVAARVANERGESRAGIGSVGHVVRGDSAMCNSTRLMFCTTGVLLRQLQCSSALDCVSHVIVDEVHERHLDTDILLGILKASLDRTPHLRVILMSATIDEDRFAKYFGDGIPRMHIEGRTFPVNDFTLEDVLHSTSYVPPKNSKKRNGGYSRRSEWTSDEDGGDDKATFRDKTVSANTEAGIRDLPIIPPLAERIKRVDESSIDYALVGHLVKHLIQTKECGDGSILVFLPGAPEINAATKTLQKMLRGVPVRLLPLHGGLQPKDQNLVFQSVQRGCTKVILSTNIAETSITIQDCTIVIDSCREKQLSYDPNNRMPLLVETFASRSSLKQRRGRAGRVREGTCYKLISKSTLSKLKEHGEPEILRCALDQTLLSLLFLRLEDGTGKFLSTLLDPPSRESIEAALFNLERLGAVEKEGEGACMSLTPLGMHLAGIPAPPTVGKICVVGCILGCRRAALAIAAGMSLGRSPFLRISSFPTKRNKDEESFEAMKEKSVISERKKLLNNVGNSDHALLAAAYIKWESCGTGGGERKRCCDNLGLSFNGMKDMKQLVSQLDAALSNIGFHDNGHDNTGSWSVVRACVVAALAPSQLVKVIRPSQKYTETVEGAIEKEGNAKEIKLFIRGMIDDQCSFVGSSVPSNSPESSIASEQRVFMHPSSANFDVGSYDCPWLVYHELVKTSKAFVRDSTECSSYALLLFGGQLDVQASKGIIVIDNWAKLAANPRIGALIGGLRQKVDEVLSKKVEDPTFDVSATSEMKIIIWLLVSDGLGF